MDRVDINFQKKEYILLSFFSWQIFVACKEGVYIIVKIAWKSNVVLVDLVKTMSWKQ